MVQPLSSSMLLGRQPSVGPCSAGPRASMQDPQVPNSPPLQATTAFTRRCGGLGASPARASRKPPRPQRRPPDSLPPPAWPPSRRAAAHYRLRSVPQGGSLRPNNEAGTVSAGLTPDAIVEQPLEAGAVHLRPPAEPRRRSRPRTRRAQAAPRSEWSSPGHRSGRVVSARPFRISTRSSRRRRTRTGRAVGWG